MHISLVRRAQFRTMKAVSAGTGIGYWRYASIEHGDLEPTDAERQAIADFLKYPADAIDFAWPRLTRENGK